MQIYHPRYQQWIFAISSTDSKSTSANYDPFGNVITQSGLPEGFMFNEQLLDSGSNLYFLRARYYDPETGRFISRDPVKGYATQPQTLNPYSYAINNPVNKADPSGQDYVNVGFSVGTLALGASCGVLISNQGVYPYVGAGISTPGPGVSATYSPADPSTGFSISAAAQIGVAGSYNYDLDTKSTNYELGVGTPRGASLLFTQTFDKL